MGIEIERKFLLTSDAWRTAARNVLPMAQGYLNGLAVVDSGAMNTSVRVRIQGDTARLNIKSRELGSTRQEFDYDIPMADARALLALCIGGIIHKRRYLVKHAGHLWEIDEFLGENTGLLVAEIELESAEEGFVRPSWLGVEATHAQRYYNLALASRPYSHWREDERAATDLKDPRLKDNA